MIEITGITNEAKQKMRLVGENNERIDFTLIFRPSQSSWFFNLEYEDFNIYGSRLTESPDILHGYHNLLPFGIMCSLENRRDPFFLDDFSADRAKLYLLTSDEVSELESLIA